MAHTGSARPRRWSASAVALGASVAVTTGLVTPVEASASEHSPVAATAAERLPPVAASQATPFANRRPNIVMIMVDDVPKGMMDAMPKTRRLIVQKGVSFSNGMVPTALCSPSRASTLTGRYAHTTRVYENGVFPSQRKVAGWWAFRKHERSTIATALTRAGYRTGLVGKYLNGFGDAPRKHVPAGWNEFIAFRGPDYYDYTLTGTRFERHGHRPSDYSTDVLTRHAVRFVNQTPKRKPLFLYYAPFAAHDPFVPAPRHRGRWHTEKIDGAFNEQDMSDKPRFAQKWKKKSRKVQRREVQKQHEMLMAVDEGVARIVRALGPRARQTLFVFISDNGYLHGAHRFVGKNVPYRLATEVPIAMRWDGAIKPRTVSERLTLNIDVTATIAEAAGISMAMDGRSALTTDRQGTVLEQMNSGRPPYCGYRTKDWLYVRWSRGRGEELYHYPTDPHEKNSLHNDPRHAAKKAELAALARQACSPPPPKFRW